MRGKLLSVTLFLFAWSWFGPFDDQEHIGIVTDFKAKEVEKNLWRVDVTINCLDMEREFSYMVTGDPLTRSDPTVLGKQVNCYIKHVNGKQIMTSYSTSSLRAAVKYAKWIAFLFYVLN